MCQIGGGTSRPGARTAWFATGAVVGGRGLGFHQPAAAARNIQVRKNGRSAPGTLQCPPGQSKRPQVCVKEGASLREQPSRSGGDSLMFLRWHKSWLSKSLRDRLGLALEEMGIDILELLRILPLSLQVEVVNQFDVQGTRDGNLKSRFISFVRGVWLRHLQAR